MPSSGCSAELEVIDGVVGERDDSGEWFPSDRYEDGRLWKFSS